jgi:acyl-[acyl carrier protein]--UDP-N-acetylglucosamine O-acyltransferase
MSTLNNIFAKFSAQEPMKVQLSLLSDFKAKYEKAVDESASVANLVIDALQRAEVAAAKLKEISKMYQDAYALGAKLQSSSEELGVKLDAAQLNAIEIAKRNIDGEAQTANKVIGYIKQAYQAL